jgi:hypothetical protein
LNAGLSVDEIERIRQGEFASGWALEDELVLRATSECLQKRRITKKTLADLHERFDTTQLMDLIAIFGVYVILGTMINTWGLELDDFIDFPGDMQEDSWLGS